MDTNGIWELLDIMILVCGVYAGYGAYVLKNEGKIVRALLLSKDIKEESCKDLQGYANMMSPKLGILAGVMIVYSVISLLNTHVVNIMTLYWVAMVGMLAVMFWYSFQAKKAVQMYF